MFIEIWVYKEGVVYVYNRYYSAIKKEWNNVICSNMDGLGGHYAKRNKSDRER